MNSDFQNKIVQEGKVRDVSELPAGVIMEADRTNVIIPLCCKEGWDSCPHVPRKQKKVKTNIGI